VGFKLILLRMDNKSVLEAKVLATLAKDGQIADSSKFVSKAEHEVLVGVLLSLVASEFVVLKSINNEETLLTAEGTNCAQNGSPEAQVFKAVGSGCTMAELNTKVGADICKIGWSQCMRQKLCTLDKATGTLRRLAEEMKDETQASLQAVQAGKPLDKKVSTELKKRKMITVRAFKSYAVAKGPQFSTERKKYTADLTADLLKKKAWQEAEFKEYNFAAKGPGLSCGALHPLMKVRHQFRLILLELGFEEMPTNNFVESSFWNFDSLFQPQQHPARDSHDTFFVESPARTTNFPVDYCKRVQETHEKGGFGSIGYRYDWKIEEAQKNILRTHTTAISSQMLYKLANREGGFQPARYFSIDRVFRNESLDYTHLAEFHQVEGLVADYGLTLGDLIGTIKTFFNRIGIDNVRFKPAYNPYTEPSMEIFGFSKELDKWVEIGNSGMFRPEMIRPMGIPEGVNVIAWGLSLERPTMIKYGIKSIRTLFGPRVNLDIIATNPIARYE